MIGRLPYPIYRRLVQIIFWWGPIWCQVKYHRLYIGRPEDCGESAPLGYGCKRCDWWSSANGVRLAAKDIAS